MDGSVFRGERQLKKVWLLQAMEAWLKRDACSEERPYFSTRRWGLVVASAVPCSEEGQRVCRWCFSMRVFLKKSSSYRSIPMVKVFNFSIIID